MSLKLLSMVFFVAFCALLATGSVSGHSGDHKSGAGCHLAVEASVEGPGCYQKPGADVRLLSYRPASLEPGDTTEVLLVLGSAAKSGTMVVKVTGGEGLLVVGTDSVVFPLDGRDAYVVPVQVQALAPGRHYLNLQVTLEDGRSRSSRALSARVESGNRSDVSHRAAKTEPAEASIRVRMPARETISRPRSRD